MEKFNIIKHAGQVDEVITHDGIKVHRENTVLVGEIDDSSVRFVACAPYDNHFVFIDPMWKQIRGRWFAMCTCGSPAVIVGSNAYKKDGSPSTEGTIKGEMLVCHLHATTGKHADGAS